MTTSISNIFGINKVSQALDDPHYGLRAAYRGDSFERKLDLVIGIYRDDEARPWVLPTVRKAEEIFHQESDRNHEYLPIAGLLEFVSAAQKIILGEDSPALREGRVCSLQTVSGTGAVHLGASFISKFLNQPTLSIYLSDPSWPNHYQIFNNAGIPLRPYKHIHESTKSLDLDGFTSTLSAAPRGSIVLLQACAHNPTGVDPTEDQWKEIARLMKDRSLIPFFDCAYQGFASGSLSRDNFAIRHFVNQGFDMFIAQSFSKNLGLYGQRVGCFHFVASPGSDAQQTAKRVQSQLSALQRTIISNPPIYGAKIASIILTNEELLINWQRDMRVMSGRIILMRESLKQALTELRTPGDWSHITRQIGMFAYTGLSEAQVLELRHKWHVYLTEDGRMNMAGLTTNTVSYFVQAVDDVVRRIAQ